MGRKVLSEQIVASSLFGAKLMGEVYKSPNLIRSAVDRIALLIQKKFDVEHGKFDFNSNKKTYKME